MNAKLIFFLFTILTTHVFGADDLQQKSEPAAVSVTKEVADEDLKKNEAIDLVVVDNATAKPPISPYLQEMLTKLMKAMSNQPVENMPVDVFLIERATWDSIRVNSGFWAKYCAQTFMGLCSYVVPSFLSSSFLLKSVSLPVAQSYAEQVTRGDHENFPNLSLKYLVGILEGKGVIDRDSFAKLPAHERSFEFETNERNGLIKGYKGRLVLMDFAYGVPNALQGGVHTAISLFGDQVLDHLVSYRVYKTPMERIKEYFTLPSPSEFTKVGQVWKNKGLHTCILYVLGDNTFSFYVLGMRIPEQEYLDTVEWWKEVHRSYHQSLSPSSMGGTNPAVK